MDKKTSFVAQVRSFPANFWFANVMEMLERLAFYGTRAIAPLYLVASTQNNGLGLDYKEKGVIYAVWAVLQCMIPMVSGGYTDRYGYKKSLTVAFIINIIGYPGLPAFTMQARAHHRSPLSCLPSSVSFLLTVFSYREPPRLRKPAVLSYRAQGLRRRRGTRHRRTRRSGR